MRQMRNPVLEYCGGDLIFMLRKVARASALEEGMQLSKPHGGFMIINLSKLRKIPHSQFSLCKLG